MPELLEIVKCDHILSGEQKADRIIEIGQQRVIWLCPLCSSHLELGIIQEFFRNAMKPDTQFGRFYGRR